MYQCWINVRDRQELVVHLMDPFVFQAAFLKIRECEVEQSIATQYAADRPFQDVSDLVVEDFCGIRVLVEETSLLGKLLSSSFP